MVTASEGTGGTIPAGAMELMEKLRGVTQRVAQQATFDTRVSEMEAYIAKLVQENNDRIAMITKEKDEEIDKLTKESDGLAMLAFESDIFLQSKDGIKVPAIKKTLIESSDHFVTPLKHFKESREGLITTDNSADALRYVSQCIHTSRAAQDVDADTLLEVCILAEIRDLPEVLKKAAAAFGNRFDSATALEALFSAQQHIREGSINCAVWKDIFEDAAMAVAVAVPEIVKADKF